MKKTIVLVMVLGIMTKVETVHYSNGVIVERIYDKVTDIVPADIKWVTPNSVKVKQDDVLYSSIVQREENYYNNQRQTS